MRRSAPVALVADGAVGRNVATVLNWSRREESYLAFRSSQLREAISFVGVRGPAIEVVESALRELRAALGW